MVQDRTKVTMTN